MYPATTNLTARVITFLGSGDPALVGEHVEAATSFVKAYTRDVGFNEGWPNSELENVIVSAAARSASNPTGVQSETVGPYAVTHFRNLGFTLVERAVLDRYRVRAR